MSQPIETREAAQACFRDLVQRHGLFWNSYVPAEAWVRLAECNRFLTEADRREKA